MSKDIHPEVKGMTTDQLKNACKAITPVGLLCFPRLLKAHSFEGSEPRYSCTILFDDAVLEKDGDPLRKAIDAALVYKFGASIKKSSLALPLKDAVEKAELGDSFCEGRHFISIKAKEAPGLVDRFGAPITDEKDLYPGAIVRASISAFAYSHSGNKGVSLWLNHVQKCAEGERLTARRSAADEFGATAEAAPEIPEAYRQAADAAAGLDGEAGETGSVPY